VTVADRPTVLVLGAGFGGVTAARELAKADADVIVVDAHDYHTFQPLLYQVATDLLETSTVGHPLRDLFHGQDNARVHVATSTAIDPEARTVSFDRIDPIRYDHLILGLGATPRFFGVPGAAEHGFPMYTLPDAVRLRRHVLERWEAADTDPSVIEDGALNVVVVGGGPTGVETAGAMIELYRSNFDEDYPDVDVASQATVTLVEASGKLLSMFPEHLGEYAVEALAHRGVDVRLGETVASVEPTRVTLGSGEVLPAHTLVWGAGLGANPLVHDLGVTLERGDRVPVDETLRVVGRPEIHAVGDAAWITDAATGEVLPQLGSVAMQAGRRAGRNIGRILREREVKPFRYKDKGSMATVGRKAAVAQMPHGVTLTGEKAWLAWGTVHLALLSTGEDRARATTDWAYAFFDRERAQRISVDVDRD
jgi:NADH dehydrogenase